MRKNIIAAALVVVLLLAVLPVAQAETPAATVALPEITAIEMTDLFALRVYFAGPVSPGELFVLRFRLDNYASAVRTELLNDGLASEVHFPRRLTPGTEYELVVENWQQGLSESSRFTAVETIESGKLRDKLATRNTSVQLTQNAIAIIEAGHEALLEGRQAIFDVYGELDRAVREFPELELPFPDPENDFEERMNELVTEAHRQARSALVSNRDSLVDQVISLEYQREDLMTNLAKARLQSQLAIGQLTLAAESYVAAYQALEAQLTGLEGSLALLHRQLYVADIQLSLGMITTHEAGRLRINVLELENGVMALGEQRDSLKAEVNLLLGQSHTTPLRIVATQRDFSLWQEEVDFARDLPKVLGSNLALASLAADVAQKSRALARNTVDGPERTIAEYELQNARIRYGEEERKLALAFRRMADDVAAKYRALSLAEGRLEVQSIVFGHSRLRHELGMISPMQLEAEELEFLSVRRSVGDAGRELALALLRYSLMLDGLTL